MTKGTHVVLGIIVCIIIAGCSTHYINQLEIGMTINDVTGIMGEEGMTYFGGVIDGKNCRVIQYAFFDCNYLLLFADGKLIMWAPTHEFAKEDIGVRIKVR